MGWRYRRKNIRRYAAQDGRCWICGRPVSIHKATRDHVIPRRDGGGPIPDNILLAHGGCNYKRGHKKPHHDDLMYLAWVNEEMKTYICFKFSNEREIAINSIVLKAGVV